MTSPDSAVDEDLALLEEMRTIRPGVKSIVLAARSTPDDVIAALRARVFACFTPPFDQGEIAKLARSAASESQWRDDIQLLSAKPGWVSVRVNSRLVTAERVLTFAKELNTQLPEDTREEILLALREILLAHGTWRRVQSGTGRGSHRRPDRKSTGFFMRDPGAGFRRESLSHAATGDPSEDPTAHVVRRDADEHAPEDTACCSRAVRSTS